MNGSKYGESFSILDESGQQLHQMTRTDWVDFDQNGKLIILKEGKLFVEEVRDNKLKLHELANFNNQLPETRRAPEWATRWSVTYIDLISS